MARQGLSVLRSPLPAAGAILLQCGGWLLQLFAVYVSMRAFDIHAAGGRTRAADERRDDLPALAGQHRPAPGGRRPAARSIRRGLFGFAYALVLQVVEMSVGVGVGLIFLAREGLSFATVLAGSRRKRKAS